MKRFVSIILAVLMLGSVFTVSASAQLRDDGAKRLLDVVRRQRRLGRHAARGIRFPLIPEDAVDRKSKALRFADAGVIPFLRGYGFRCRRISAPVRITSSR